jgi:hypothetical protein
MPRVPAKPFRQERHARSIAGCDTVRNCAQGQWSSSTEPGCTWRGDALALPCGPLARSIPVAVRAAISASRTSVAVHFYVVSCPAREPAMSCTCVQLQMARLLLPSCVHVPAHTLYDAFSATQPPNKLQRQWLNGGSELKMRSGMLYVSSRCHSAVLFKYSSAGDSTTPETCTRTQCSAANKLMRMQLQCPVGCGN